MANVRIFGYPGIAQIQQMLVKQFTGHGVFVRQEPYLWSQNLVLNGATPVESVVQANDVATIVVIEVDDATAVRYELNPGGPTGTGHRAASTNSPKLTGENVFQWFKGATISFVDAASV
jgi:hypothetical protein